MGSIDLSYQMFNYRDLDILMVGPKGKGGISILQENLISELSSKFQIQRCVPSRLDDDAVDGAGKYGYCSE